MANRLRCRQPHGLLSFMSINLEESFLSYLRIERGLSDNTLIAYGNDISKLAAFAQRNNKDLLTLQQDDLASFIRFLSKEGLGARSVARVLVAVRGFYKFLLQDGHLKHDPSINLESPRATVPLPRFLTSDEVERLLAAPDVSTPLGLRDKTMLEVLYATGLRVSELIRIAPGDLNLDLGFVTVIGKGNKERAVPLGRSAVQWTRKYLATRKQSDVGSRLSLFTTETGRPLTRQAFWAIIVEYGEKARIGHITPHLLRHSF